MGPESAGSRLAAYLYLWRLASLHNLTGRGARGGRRAESQLEGDGHGRNDEVTVAGTKRGMPDLMGSCGLRTDIFRGVLPPVLKRPRPAHPSADQPRRRPA